MLDRTKNLWARFFQPKPQEAVEKDYPEIHISDVRTYLSCRRKWNYVSPLRRNLEPRAYYQPFIVGRAIHYALEAYYDSGRETHPRQAIFNWFQAELQSRGPLLPGEQEEWADMIELCVGLTEHYYLWVQRPGHAKKFSDENLDVIAMETEFNVPIMKGKKRGPFNLAGRFDGIVRHKETGEHWIFESKTSRSTKELGDTLWNDNQATAYSIAAQKIFGVPIAGVLYNVMRKKVPRTPNKLKNGLFSVNKRMDTSYDHYLYTIYSQDPRPEDVSPEDYRAAIRRHYGEMLDYLVQPEEAFKWFARIPIRRTPKELELGERDLYDIAMDMTNPKQPLYPSPSWMNCKFCMFKEPCMRKNKGQTDKDILRNEFQKRRQWDPMSGKEEDDE